MTSISSPTAKVDTCLRRRSKSTTEMSPSGGRSSARSGRKRHKKLPPQWPPPALPAKQRRPFLRLRVPPLRLLLQTRRARQEPSPPTCPARSPILRRWSVPPTAPRRRARRCRNPCAIPSAERCFTPATLPTRLYKSRRVAPPGKANRAMTLKSMTGFARADGVHGETSWSWEARSVNGRNLDLRLRLPTGFEALEIKARNLCQEKLARGNCTINLAIRREGRNTEIRLNEAALAQAREVADRAQALTKLKSARLDPLLG